MTRWLLLAVFCLSEAAYGTSRYIPDDERGVLSRASSSNSVVGENSSRNESHIEVGENNSETSLSTTDQSITEVEINRQEAARAVTYIQAYCGQGMGAGTFKLTFTSGSLDYTCASSTALTNLLNSYRELLASAQAETDPHERAKLLTQARDLRQDIYNLNKDVIDHLEFEKRYNEVSKTLIWLILAILTGKWL